MRMDIFRALANVKLQGMGIVQAGKREGKKAEGEQIGRLYVWEEEAKKRTRSPSRATRIEHTWREFQTQVVV